MFRTTLSISAGLAVLAVVLASLWIGFGPRPQGGQDKRASAAMPMPQGQRSPVDAKGQTIRAIAPGAPSGPGMASVPPSAASSAAGPSGQKMNPDASADPGAPGRQSDNPSLAGLRTQTAPDAQSATPGGGVDLNTATVDQLNALGAGMIGKRIMEFRPYSATDDLLTRRVLKRADYEIIRPAITVR